MGEQWDNCKIEIKSKLWKNVSNGSHKDEAADSGCWSGFWRRNEEEDEYSVMILPVLPCWHVRTPRPEVPGWSSMFATSQPGWAPGLPPGPCCLFRSVCPVISLSTPSFCLRTGRTNHSSLNVPTYSFTNPCASVEPLFLWQWLHIPCPLDHSQTIPSLKCLL